MNEHEKEWLTVTRDCDALLIPTAIPISIPKGSRVLITQQLGGTITVQINGNLARIDGKDVDALGLDPTEIRSENVEFPTTADGPVDMDLVWEELKTCFDPEIPVNIVDLGLVYECQSTPTEAGGNKVHIQMTLTAPGCGMGPTLAADVEAKVRKIPNVTEIEVELVFDPPWSMDKMSDAAKLTLGMF